MILFDSSKIPGDFLFNFPLRKTSSFTNPGSQEILPVVIGRWEDIGLPGILIDPVKNLYIWSDIPVKSISKVSVLDSSGQVEETTTNQTSFKFYNSIEDSTGRLVSMVQSNTNLGNKKILVFGTGIVYKSLILENPSNILEWAVDFLGFSKDNLNTTKLEKIKFYFAQNNISLRYYLNSTISFKTFLDTLSTACFSPSVSFNNKLWIDQIIREGF